MTRKETGQALFLTDGIMKSGWVYAARGMGDPARS